MANAVTLNNRSTLSVITDGAMTGTTTLTGTPLNVLGLSELGVQVTWTSTAVGTLTVSGSNDNVTYYALTFNPTLTQPAGTAGGYLIDLTFRYAYIQVSYTNTSSTGVLNVSITGKGAA